MSEHVAKVATILAGKDLGRLRMLNEGDCQVFTQLVASGISPRLVPEVLRSYDPGRAYSPQSAHGVRPTRNIMAYSFVRDANQYRNTYGQSDEWAGRLRGLLEEDRPTALAMIERVVNAKLAAKGSDAVAKVEYGQGRGSPGSATTGGESDPNYPDLARKMRQFAAQAGIHRFNAVDAGEPRERRFVCALEGGLITGAQKKATAQMAARLCRVLGRYDPVLKPYIGYIDDSGVRRWDAVPARFPSGAVGVVANPADDLPDIGKLEVEGHGGEESDDDDDDDDDTPAVTAPESPPQKRVPTPQATRSPPRAA
nr:MAG: PAS-rich protein [Aspergillus flavus polymycovirus 1]